MTFKDWCATATDDAEDDDYTFVDCEIMQMVMDGELTGSYKNMDDKIFNDNKLFNRYSELGQSLDKLYLRYIYEVNL